jgi:putative effector of murein hydrolase LrgA (UPF0299 family)
MRSVWKTALIWGVVGVGIPLLFTLGSGLLALLHPFPLFSALDGLREDVELFVWPTSFWLMATEGAGPATTVEIVLAAVLANCVVYLIVGLVLTAVWRRLKRVTARLKSSRPARGG